MTGPPNQTSNQRPYGHLLAMLIGASLFALGWWFGQRSAPKSQAPPPPVSATTSPASPTAEVRLRLETSAVRLLPEHPLRLKPTPNWTPDAGSPQLDKNLQQELTAP